VAALDSAFSSALAAWAPKDCRKRSRFWQAGTCQAATPPIITPRQRRRSPAAGRPGFGAEHAQQLFLGQAERLALARTI
jgi:hypothetical protein